MNRSNEQEDRKLYRNPAQAKILGVCAGVAEYFGLEVWLVRIIAVSMILLSAGSAIVVIYFVLYFILDVKPDVVDSGTKFDNRKSSKTTEHKPYRSTVGEVWKAGKPPSDMLEEIEQKFSIMERKLQSMESFVTSQQFELERAFKKI